jgi:glycosyltransferase involved in cell wall biosynthesis
VAAILASQATYFHVDEIMRPPFYVEWDRKQYQNKILTIVSTLSAVTYKGIDLILKTAKILTQYTSISYEWIIVGIDPDNKLLRFFEKHLNIFCKDVKITIEGVKTSEALVELLKGASIFVHPSYIDNSPNGVCEAQMMGLPVIACNVGGISSLIENNVNGILVPSNAPFELVTAIKTLAMDSNLSYRLGNQAKLTAMKRHNREKISTDILQIYKILSDL